jgi:hypothetical protein
MVDFSNPSFHIFVMYYTYGDINSTYLLGNASFFFLEMPPTCLQMPHMCLQMPHIYLENHTLEYVWLYYGITYCVYL